MNDTDRTIFINYGGRGFTGEICIHSMEYFPIPVTHMKRLIKICQMSTVPEEYYLNEFLEVLKYLEDHSTFFSSHKNKRIKDDIKVLQARLDRIGGRL